MLIKALCDYNDIKEQQSTKNTDLFTEQSVSYMITLTLDGTISDIIDIRIKEERPDGKNKTKTFYIPRKIDLPFRSQKSAIDLNIIEHRPLYIFGLNYDKVSKEFTPYDKTQKAEKSHKTFKEGNLAFCENLEDDIIIAYRNFMLKWEPKEQISNPHLQAISNEYNSSYFCFALDGDPTNTLHSNKALVSKFIKQKQENDLSDTEKITAICPIEGKELTVSRLHDKIYGIRGGSSVGSILVGYNNAAFESYGKSQSYNSGISEIAMKKYTKELNNLLADKQHSFFIDDMSLVFFAISKNDKDVCNTFLNMLSGTEEEKLDRSLTSVVSNISSGRVSDLEALKTNEDLIFYVIGLTPNTSRISQKLFVKNSFGKIISNLKQHQLDLQIKKDNNQIPIWSITSALISPKVTNPKAKKETVPSPLLSAIFLAMLNGSNYPIALLDIVIRRVKTDCNKVNPFINNIRMSIIKACLNRKARFLSKKEEISMSLDEKNNNQSYLCGRLFAVLEYLQQKVSNNNLNRTIKDSFFSSACVRPATVFPKLMMLAQNHLSKLDNTVYFNKLIGGIITQLNSEFPSTLTLDEQGKFIIGYYHQNNALYKKKTDSDESSTENKEDNHGNY